MSVPASVCVSHRRWRKISGGCDERCTLDTDFTTEFAYWLHAKSTLWPGCRGKSKLWHGPCPFLGEVRCLKERHGANEWRDTQTGLRIFTNVQNHSSVYWFIWCTVEPFNLTAAAAAAAAAASSDGRHGSFRPSGCCPVVVCVCMSCVSAHLPRVVMPRNIPPSLASLPPLHPLLHSRPWIHFFSFWVLSACLALSACLPACLPAWMPRSIRLSLWLIVHLDI